MEIRTLRRPEREALLELLDGWEVGDGWHGADFFRRLVEDDPTFRDEQVFVAAEGRELLSCVQIFPRALRTAAGTVPMGGVGTVFTREDARRRGLAEKLLEWAATDMTARGMCVSVLFAARIPWYSRLGWRSFGVRRTLLERGSGGPSESTGPEAEAFVPERDLAAVRALYEAYSGDLPGGVARDDALWQASLRNSGNPEEEFLVARAGGELVAYLRAVVLSGILVVMEFGRTPGFEDALARLFVELMEPRVPDPLATGAKPSAELRRVASTVGLHFDPDLGAALARRGIIQKEHADPTCMLRCMDADALGSRLGVPRQEGEAPNDFLFRMLPPEDLTFWPADRF